MTNLIIDVSEKFIHKKLKKIYFFSKVVYTIVSLIVIRLFY